MIKRISLRRLTEGGAAIFALQLINHHNVIEGKILIIPFVRKILRVWVNSYVELASRNRAEDDKPCAIIIARAPCHPHSVEVKIPARRIPICPIDE